MAMREVETVYLGGGCFWCVEAVFLQMRGVRSAQSGYMGGHVSNPTYEQVCTGRTGHAEVVEVTFEPQTLSFRDVLEVFFATHDPTTLNRQGADVGTQYRSAVFFTSDEQATTARDYIANLQPKLASPIVTEVTPAAVFYQAEAYHDDYFRRNPGSGYCRAVIAPKIQKFRKQFHERLTS